MNTLRLGGCVSAVFLLTLALSPTAYGQQPTDATLTIRFVSGQTVFHVGEIIPIDLSFSTTAEKTYLWQGGPPIVGCFAPDSFNVSPPGIDTLKRLEALGGGWACSIATSVPQYLGSRPRKIREYLNDWVTLPKPGQYTLYVTSRRLHRREGSKDEPVELRSNTLYFQVVPADPGWQAQELTSATGVLGDPDSTAVQKRAALHALRFLDSPGSLAELVRQLTLPVPLDPQGCFDGLMGSAHPRLVLRDLENRFVRPDAGITHTFLNSLADAEFLESHGPMPAYPAAGAMQQAEWRRETGQRYDELRQIQNRLYARAAAMVPSKQGLAQAETVRMLVTWAGATSAGYAPPAHIPGDTLASAFLQLPPEQEAEILEDWWNRVDVPEMSSALESVLDQSKLGDRELRDIALRRLYELDPADGAAQIMAEIQQPHYDVGNTVVRAQALSLLPDKTLPQFDSLLAARLAQKDSRTMDLDAGLIGRYATKAILPQVKAVYLKAPGKWDCNVEDGLLVYFLRTDTNFAIQHAGLSTTLCTPLTFRLLSKMGLWSKVQPRIIAKLDDPNSSVALQAARVLSRYGDAKAEQALWARLRGLHGQWARYTGNFVYGEEAPRPVQEAVEHQAVLALAIAQAQNWLLDDSQMAALANLTLGPERQEVASWGWKSPLEVDLSFFGLKFFANIGSIYHTTHVDSLCAKLSQFPEGTRIRINASGPQEQLAPVVRAVDQAAEQYGLVVEDGPKR